MNNENAENMINRLNSAQTADEVDNIFRGFAEGLGANVITCADVDTIHPSRRVFHTAIWPRRWNETMRSNGHVFFEPQLGERKRPTGVTLWSHLRQNDGIAIADLNLLEILTTEGWIDGVTVTASSHSHYYGFTSLASTRSISPDILGTIGGISVAYYHKKRSFSRTGQAAIPPLGLSGDELEIVRSMANGHSDFETAEKFGISGYETSGHIAAAKRKLGARNRADMVRIAALFSII